jgi:hypothetical protein
MLAAVAPADARQERRDTTQRAGVVADTTGRTSEDDVLRRLRALGPLRRADTTAVTDTSAAADEADAQPPGASVRFEGRSQRGADATSGIAHDSIMRALLRTPGYTATEYLGGRASFDTDSARLELRDDAVVVRDGQKLTADSTLVYWERVGLACGQGRPTFSGRGIDAPVQSDSLCFDVTRGVGVAIGAETTVSEGAEWRLRGTMYFDQGSGSAYGHDAIFTDCDEPFPHVHYHFSAGEVKVSPNNVLVARNVTLNFQDVPVFWLPFMVQSLAQGRRSGILMPRFGINDIARSSPRYNRRVEDIGFYWAINDYLGSEVALDWFSDNWTALRGSFDWNVQNRFLTGGATFRNYWQGDGGRNFTLSAQNSWRPDERTNVALSANYATSSAFVREQSFDPRELNRSIDSNVSLGRRFDWASVSTRVSRRQDLQDNTVRWTLPSVGFSFPSVTLFGAAPGDESWFSNASWRGDANMNVDRVDVAADNIRNVQGRRDATARARSSFTIGRFGWSQDFDIADNVAFARDVPGDTVIALPARNRQTMRWTTSLNFQQRLIGTSSFTPSFSLSGGTLRSDTTGMETVAEPTRMNFGASLRTDVFGFWPGVGPFEVFRHRVSPTFTYTYSPRPSVTDRQREVFGLGELREQNRISIGLTQTFEARMRARVEDPAPARVPTDTTDVDIPGDAFAEDTISGPRRRDDVQRISLLSINTDAVAYDFVAARQDGRGVQTNQISNSLQSDLLRGMQIRFTHDLFEPVLGPEGQQTGDRRFAPHLSGASASFSLNNESWIFRVLGLGGRPDDAHSSQPQPTPDEAEGGPAIDRTQTEYGVIGTRRRAPMFAPSDAVGAWSANLNYTLSRPRSSQFGAGENQMLNGSVRFQPTAAWSVSWNTGYSFTTGEFTDHILTLTRRLHDWDANFDFVRAQNGNFTFMFRVALRANPDVKVDYTQRDRRANPF